MPIKEYICTTTECHEKDDIKELLVKMDEVPVCECCGLDLKRTYTKGSRINTKGCSPASRSDTH